MQASDYLRMKLQSDRQLSIYTQHGFSSFAQATKNIVSDIYSGIEGFRARYFSILYTAQLEMLYYFIEPILEEIFKKVKIKAYSRLDELYEEVREEFNV
ncbi:MAG: hypothetical protein P4L95_08305 [Rouxiella aceris]|uniref:hypothetical protein n=1 Tax=Rouxiella aceris TaxID=2703884 RepID=UPI00284697E2|nr:hypothetical protein [Rouxiella aceris]MDR3431888.1 hypothetical protein [Rouxiella aceris]